MLSTLRKNGRPLPFLLAGIAGACAVGTSAAASQLPADPLGGGRLAEQFAAALPQSAPLVTVARPTALAPRERRAGRGQIYVSWQNLGGIALYTQRGKNQQAYGFIGGPSSGLEPAQLFVDRDLTLWVPSAESTGSVVAFPVGRTIPSHTLTGASFPYGVVVSKSGIVYVANYNGGGNGTVIAYARGHSLPTKTIATFASNAFPLAVALDAAENLYVSYDTNYGSNNYIGGVMRFARGSTHGLDLGIQVGLAYGLTFDRHGNLLLTDESASAIDVFPPGATTPSAQLFVPGGAVQAALNRDESELWVAGGPSGSVYGVSYPDGAILDRITDVVSPYGIAVSLPDNI